MIAAPIARPTVTADLGPIKLCLGVWPPIGLLAGLPNLLGVGRLFAMTANAFRTTAWPGSASPQGGRMATPPLHVEVVLGDVRMPEALGTLIVAQQFRHLSAAG